MSTPHIRLHLELGTLISPSAHRLSREPVGSQWRSQTAARKADRASPSAAQFKALDTCIHSCPALYLAAWPTYAVEEIESQLAGRGEVGQVQPVRNGREVLDHLLWRHILQDDAVGLRSPRVIHCPAFRQLQVKSNDLEMLGMRKGTYCHVG